MRRHGHVHTAAGLGLQGHACWLYADEQELRDAALAFLEDGVELGQRLMYLGPGSVEKLRRDLDGLTALDHLLATGGLRIMPLENVYEVGAAVDPLAQLAVYSAATSAALADGYTGLRVVGDGTPLVLDAELWRAHTHWETVADRFMARHPMAALCCYDRRALPDEILHDLGCVHRSSNAPAVPFRLFAGREGMGIGGEVDAFSADGLLRLLDSATPPDGDLVLELDELDFIDHRGVLAIADHARELARGGRRVHLRGAPPSFDRLTELLGVAL
ncbi:MAG TPA: MEDS domain-containing protein [Thermoleophilaceae bacterium]|jgi:anti-anti-sigma regulatory factor